MSTESQQYANRSELAVKKKTAFNIAVTQVMEIFGWLLLALSMSIVMEWIGMSFIWNEQGVEHSRSMIIKELSYVNDETKLPYVGGQTPATVARNFSTGMDYYLFEWTHIRDFLAWVMSAPDNGSTAVSYLKSFIMVSSDYIASAINTTQVFSIRLAVAFMSFPLFLLVGTVALIDGMVERELRRYGGANESAYIYHNVKPWTKPVMIGAFVLYLGYPDSIHPNVILIPFVTAYGVVVFIVAKTFKKFL